MTEETTNGGNTGEQGAPAPGKKFFKPVDENWKYNPRTPVNYRPRGEQIAFIEDLVRLKKSQNLAIEHCVLIAMGKPAPAAVPADQKKEIERLTGDLKLKNFAIAEGDKLLKKLQAEITALKAAAPKEVIKEKEVPMKLDDDHKASLGRILAKKNLKTPDEAIRYAIKYTAKNDWL